MTLGIEMAQYQSFPGAPGDSLSLDKLKALQLPPLKGKRFLDVGCNEGFFCGYADFLGAERSVGLDRSALFLERARARFGGCEFITGSWDQLPEGDFDVILLASALHYAEDQPALVHSLVDKLSMNGVLVLELGIASSPKSEWVRVTRGIDERYFPSMPLLRELLAPYAWKWMGPSVKQDGDPVNRHVLHISRRRSVAYLLMQPPAFGKTSIANGLFEKAGCPVVSGDALVARIAEGKQPVSKPLGDLASTDFSPFRLDATIQKIFDSGLQDELLDACLEGAGGSDFALDMYVPTERHAAVQAYLCERGYLPVTLAWDKPGARPPSQRDVDQWAERFYLSLVEPAPESTEAAADAAWRPDGCGFIDEASFVDGVLALRGWAVDRDGRTPGSIEVRVGERVFRLDGYERQIRHDVQRSLDLPHGLFGYRLVLDVPGVDARVLARSLQVGLPDGASFGSTRSVSELLQEARPVSDDIIR
ncbi:class I SAM-dependent methyltransferase [Marilutibacter aestuarii]|uniref:Methyltransferase domain-containing protein n=1 Tax=Marilutibacter aestuarii TaxID=1706195 RepID=A0A508AM46_9GAMM|nr:methyltransferase domain-containing protein [Lysobacter aestuarii]TQD51006.1 methyltransferase domain-containing protein [Lysobacter aestuarii]